MRKGEESSSTVDQVAASAAASGLVPIKVMDCLLQVLMNKELLLPSKVNDIYHAAKPLIADAAPLDAQGELVRRLAGADLPDRLGELEGDHKVEAFP